MKNHVIFFTVLILILSGACTSKLRKQTHQAVAPSSGGDYQDVRILKFPIAVQCWTFRKFTFFETMDKTRELGVDYLQAYSKQPLAKEYPGAIFRHELPDDTLKLVKKKLKEAGLSIISYGVVKFENNEQDMRKVFDFAKKMRIKTIVTEPPFDDYSLLEQMVKEYEINIAVHNHPAPSKYARPGTVLERIKGRDSRMGACADIGHWMRTGVNPVEALKVLKGRIIDVHLKDLNAFSKKKAHDVPYGQGKANIHDILAELTRQNYGGALVIEYENKKEVDNPIPSIKKGIDYIKSITYFQEYDKILKWQGGRYSKHGWNHYGPGFFDLDGNTGILTSHGGMGLFWYSEKKYRDFVLELDFKCYEKTTNSGVFIRVPEIPVSNDYIYHSFEVQINDGGDDIHKTAAVYDANAPSQEASHPTGQWNHFQITFKGEKIVVELNGIKVNDWQAKPSGKVRDFAESGYIGLQNHHGENGVFFRNIYVKALNE
jgi:sugar phosphate isomerase/epimerase